MASATPSFMAMLAKATMQKRLALLRMALRVAAVMANASCWQIG